MTAVEIGTMEDTLRNAKRNVWILAAAQSFLGAVSPISISVGGLIGYQLLDSDKSLATAPVTGFTIGTAFGAIVIAFLSRYLGRKASFIIGGLISISGGLVAALALFRGSFWLFAVGLLVIGLAAGFTQKIRFAAADISPSFYKPKAISWILAGGVISSILGPQVVIWTKDLLEPITFAGAFLSIMPVAFIGMLLITLVSFKPSVAHAAASADERVRSLREIVVDQRFITGMVTGVSSYALMSFLMTGAPLAMVVGCGYSTDLATLGIQWHVMAMFAPSFFTGQLIARFGVEKVVAIGIFLLMLCAAVALAGIELWNFWGALVLLGLGWNFGFIGSTAIITSSYSAKEADKVQGFHDIVLFSIVAVASFSAGKMFNAYGWLAMNLVIWPVAIVCLVMLYALATKRRRTS